MRSDQARWTTLGVALAATCALVAVLGFTPRPALAVCGDGTVDTGDGEDCDDGGLCTDGDHAGEKCPAAVSGGVDCGEGITCKTYGGDGCAANCTTESTRLFTFDSAKSKAEIQAAVLPIPFTLTGSQVLTTSSHADANGNYGVVVKAADVHIDPIAVGGLGLCACVRGAAAKTCGGSPTGRDCAADSTVCLEGEGKCIFVHGPGNTASGTIGCSANGTSPIDIAISRDHNTHKDSPDPDPDCTAPGAALDIATVTGTTTLKHPGACNGPSVATPTGTGPAGAALLLNSLSITTIPDGGSCAHETNTKVCIGGTNPGANCTTNASVCTSQVCMPAKGANGIPCDEDDPNQAAAATVPLTTGTASATITHANNSAATTMGPGLKCGSANCAASITGAIFSCSALAADSSKGVGGAALGSAFPALDNASLGDLLVTTALAAVADQAPCTGDCDGLGSVSVDELVKGVNIALGNATLDTCPAFDSDNNQHVTVDELVQGVNNALNGCPAP